MNLTSSIKDFRNILQSQLAEDSFKRNLAITFSAQAFGQVLGFLFTPFIARTYGPETYGIFSLFMAIAAPISAISTLQFPTGYVSAKSRRELHVLIQLTLITLVFFVVTTSASIIFFEKILLDVLDANSLDFFIYLLPIYVLLMGIDYILLGWNIYLKEFGRGAIAKISSIVISKGSTLLYGMFVFASTAGLILGNLIIYPLESVIKSSKGISADLSAVFRVPSRRELKDVLIRFKSYPLFVTPGLLLVNLNGQLPLYFFSLYFDTSYVGFFALANSVITIPLSVLTNSTTTVFLQKAAETLRANPESLKALVTELYNKLFLICFLPLTLFAFISTWAFDLVFGASWQQAGWIASLLAVNAMLTVPQQPLSVLFRLLNREHNNFMLTLVSIALRVAGLSLGIIYQDIRLAICGFVLGSIFSSALSITSIFRMVDQRAANLFWHVLAVVAVLLILNLEYLVS